MAAGYSGVLNAPLATGKSVSRRFLEIALVEFLTELQSRTGRRGRRVDDLGQPIDGIVRGLLPGNGKAVVKSEERKDAVLSRRLACAMKPRASLSRRGRSVAGARAANCANAVPFHTRAVVSLSSSTPRLDRRQ